MLKKPNFGGWISLAALGVSLLGMTGCGGLSAGDYVLYRVSSAEGSLDASCFPNGQIPDSIREDSTSIRTGTTLIVYVASNEEALLDTGGDVFTGSVDGDAFEFSGKIVDVDIPPGNTIFDSDQDGIDDAVDPFVDADKDMIDDNDSIADVEVDTDGDMLDDRFGDPLVDANMDGEDDRIVEQPSGIKFTSASNISIDMTADGSTVDGTAKTKLSQKCEVTGMGPPGVTCPVGYDTSCTINSEFTGVQIEDTDIEFGGGSLAPSP